MTSSLPKPYDIGNTILAASVSQCGRIVSVNRAHHAHGYIKLTPVEPFDNTHWYDPEIVREYRNSFLSDETQDKGYGISFPDLPTPSGFGELRFAGNENILFQEYCSDGVAITRSFFIPPSTNSLICLCEIENTSDEPLPLNVAVDGYFGITRASYGQITENGPINLPKITNAFYQHTRNEAVLLERGTGSTVTIQVIGDRLDFSFAFDDFSSATPQQLVNRGIIDIEPAGSSAVALILTVNDRIRDPLPPSIPPDIAQVMELRAQTRNFWSRFWVDTGNPEMDFVVNRNLAYTYGCCCIQSTGAMITDHQSLPLTWNRDNYYMYKLLEAVHKWKECQELKTAMKAHLKWMFASVTKAGWGRSHLTHGPVKDTIFQFDQQCYPIIELYEYLTFIDEDADLIGQAVPRLNGLVELLLSKKSGQCMLFETDENPADDPVLYPYHFSTQILAWKTFQCLESLNHRFRFSKMNFGDVAAKIRNDVLTCMIGEDEGKAIFCYTTDGQGNFEYYHDANDLPFALAPLWGFVDADDPVFSATVKWSFSSKNRGYYSGEKGGLGSDHAKGHWPLGTAQLLAIELAEMAGAKEMTSAGERSKAANTRSAVSRSAYSSIWNDTVRRLLDVAMDDGQFSESVYPDTGEVYTRYWFAWPGATISWLFIAFHHLYACR